MQFKPIHFLYTFFSGHNEIIRIKEAQQTKEIKEKVIIIEKEQKQRHFRSLKEKQREKGSMLKNKEKKESLIRSYL